MRVRSFLRNVLPAGRWLYSSLVAVPLLGALLN
jgi:hypothetical protein